MFKKTFLALVLTLLFSSAFGQETDSVKFAFSHGPYI